MEGGTQRKKIFACRKDTGFNNCPNQASPFEKGEE
jgi:hypothetical protein